MPEKRTYRSSYERLKALPPVVHLSELGLDPKYVRSGVRRWRQKGYLVPVGHKTGVYFNLVADEKAPVIYREEGALKALMGGRRSAQPYVTGEAALQVAGMLQGASHLIDVSVISGVHVGVSEEELGDIRLHERPQAWYDWVEAQTKGRGLAAYGLSGAPVLPPELVLADQRLYGDYAIDYSRVVGVSEAQVEPALEALARALGRGAEVSMYLQPDYGSPEM